MSNGISFPMTAGSSLPFFTIAGQCKLWETDATTPPTNIIETSENWGVTFTWQTGGPLTHIMAGSWTVTCYLDRLGPGVDPVLPPVTEPFVSSPNNYTKILTFPAGLVAPGVYKLTTTITLQGPGGPGPIALMGEGPTIEFYVFP